MRMKESIAYQGKNKLLPSVNDSGVPMPEGARCTHKSIQMKRL